MDNYKTTDLHLATFLICSKFALEKIEKITRMQCIFVFNETNDLIKVIDDYYFNRCLVNPVEYKDKLKHLKSLVLNIK